MNEGKSNLTINVVSPGELWQQKKNYYSVEEEILNNDLPPLRR